jgi:hypothetical protein
MIHQNVPFGHRPMHAPPDTLAAVLNTHPARRSPESIGAGIDRIGQNVVHDIVGRQSPDDAARLAIARLDGQFDTFVTEPDVHLTSTLELGELVEDELQRILDPLVRVFLDPVAPRFHVACCNAED